MLDADRLPQIGQAFVVGFHGTDPGEAASVVRDLRPAGVVLLPRNVETPAQLRRLTDGLQEAAARAGLPQLLVAVDQEGGAVARLASASGFPDLPSAMAVGRSGDVDGARELACRVAAMCASVGVNLVLAPCLDLALDPANEVIGTRSYGDDPEIVAAFGVAVVEGLQEGGVLACAKHAPGHGATAVDSHVAMPRLAATALELLGRDLVPFRAAVGAGCAAVMMGHVLTPFDLALPASLSAATIGGIVRSDLGHTGLVITDALEMAALDATDLPAGERGVAALAAGTDLLLFEGDAARIVDTRDAVADALATGRLDPALLASSARRLAAARARLASAPPRPSLEAVADPALRHAAERLAAPGLAWSGAPWPGAGPDGIGVLDAGSGRAFAECMGWALVTGDAASGTPVAVLVDADEGVADMIDVVRAIAEHSPTAVVVLRGARVLPGLPPTVSVLRAFDLPAGLWPVAGRRLLESWHAAGEPAS